MLIDEALSWPLDSDERWDSVAALQSRGDQDTFDAACRLLDSPDPARRELASMSSLSLESAESPSRSTA
jgi:hypothetical protein